MDRAYEMQFVVLYLPLAAAIFAALRPRQKRMFAACLLSLMWTLPALLVLQRINMLVGWWSFEAIGPLLLGMPLAVYLGWAILWGLVPELAFRKLGLPEVIAIMAAADVWLMPFGEPLVHMHFPAWENGGWLTGEAAALSIVLSPALCLARWTLDDRRLNVRAALQVVISGLLFLFLLPEVVFALRPVPNAGSVWAPLLHMPFVWLQIVVQIVLLLAVPGVSAVQEFAQRGQGTPIPYDPPKRLVTSGVYRYCANPMQLFCAVVMLLWALVLRNPWLVLAALMSAVYSAGIAHWDEERDLAKRFGEAWRQYRGNVPAWRLRWRPYVDGTPARIYIARTCGPCSAVRRWIEKRNPLGLELIDAETLPQGSIRRLRYDPADGTPYAEGVVALARALEHMNLAWAYCGIMLRLPVLHQVAQLLLDVAGFGPRTIPGVCEMPADSGCRSAI